MKDKRIKEKTYLVFIEQTDDATIIKRMTSNEIKKELKKYHQDGISIVEGNLLKDFDSVIDINSL